MFVSPSKIKRNKILKGRTLNFETPQRTHNNMVIIPTLDKAGLYSTIDSTLFRPMQLWAAFTPRRVKPVGRGVTIIDQKDYYVDLRTKTNNRIRKGKTLLQSYNGQNVVYDIFNDYNINAEALKIKRSGLMLQTQLYAYFENMINTISHDPDYTDVYLVFPITKPFQNAAKIFNSSTDYDTIDPLALFVRALNNRKYDKHTFEKIKLVMFYVPKGDILLTIDLHDPEFDDKIWPQAKQKLKRLNAFAMGQDDLLDELDDSNETGGDDEELSKEDRIENKKEEIKNVVFKQVAKTIHANNLTDFEAASRDEKDLIVSIDKKVDDYLAKPENLKKNINDMVTDIQADNDVKSKAVRYVETKKAASIRADTLAKTLEKEVETLGSLQDLDADSTSNDPVEFNVNIPHIDPRIVQSHLASIDEEYNKKQSMKDLTNVISAFSNSEYTPLGVESVNYEDTSNNQDEKKTLHVRYKSDDGKSLSFQMDIPKIVDKRYLFLGGNKKVIKKQLVRLPIVKTKSDRVEITTNYNKMTLERIGGKIFRSNEYLLKILENIKDTPGITIEYGDNSIINNKMEYVNDFEVEELSGNLNKIITPKYTLIFNRDDMKDEISLLDVDEDFFDAAKTPFGLGKVGDNITDVIYVEDGKIKLYNVSAKAVNNTDKSLFEFITNDVLRLEKIQLPHIGKKFVYTRIKFLATTYPILAVVASQKGLTNILNRYGVKYYKSEKQLRNQMGYVEVKFKDCYLYYEDIAKNTLLLNALYVMNTQDYNYSDFDIDVPYTQYFMSLLGDSVGIHVRNTLGINLDVVIDPITRDILRDLKLPTDIIDLILYGNTLLVGNHYKPQNDMTNYRIRSNEIVYDVMYGIIADAYVNYCKHKINGRPINLTIPKGILISKLQQLQNINDKSTLNPIIEAEQIAQSTAKGYRGININDAYTLEMRAYDDSMLGIVSGNATPYSGQAGITRSLSYDPRIYSVRGYIPANNGEKLSAANVLSPTELLAPFTAAGSDPPRQAMQVAQTGHTMPIMHPSKQLIGSGLNKTLAFLISDDFCFKAKQSGIVEKIDDVNKVAILKYDDGTRDAVDLYDKLDKNSNMGFYIHQLFKLVYKVGERFNADDVLAYNPSYFTGKGKDVDYQPGALAKVAITPGDFAFEDATLVSESLAKSCAAKINMLKSIVLGKNATIHKIVEKGDHVNTGDNLLEFTSSFEDPDTSEFLQKLQSTLTQDQLDTIANETVKAKYAGEVTEVEIFYNCPEEELSPSLQKLINKYRARLASRAKAIEGIHTGSVHVPPLKQVTSKKIGKAEFPEGGGVIINIYIEYIDTLGMGDKITYSTALKGVVSKVVSDDEAPVSDYRPDEHIEGVLTPVGIVGRMTLDIYQLLYTNKVLVELGKQIREIWKGER